MHGDLNPDFISGNIVESYVGSFDAEFSVAQLSFGRFNLILGMDVESRPFLHHNHSITFRWVQPRFLSRKPQLPRERFNGFFTKLPYTKIGNCLVRPALRLGTHRNGLSRFMPVEFGGQRKCCILDVQDAPMAAARRTTGRMEQERAHEQSIASGYGAKKV
jgi:hypothetical protein